LTQFSDTVRSYTEFNGVRCSMPVLADVYGLYYNKPLLAAAGYTAPPKTLSDLEDMATKSFCQSMRSFHVPEEPIALVPSALSHSPPAEGP
ncbi:extracellular solute-binding protein, partial [Rhizobium johnstonii]|uniref:extracellular solute-binding protein n=1 Tax=Rhizobium johnstonii TaxID=3019933 RepID=UPI003F954371